MSRNKKEDLPVVNLKDLAKALKHSTWPKEAGPNTKHERMAARVIIDALNYQGTNPREALLNATAWIQSAYAEGFADGAKEERLRCEERIRSVFDI